ncbi:MAG: hypothetical protein HYU80_03215 [Candidatus Blackburnbacteria bacterium]|nr:hypothetical protein [Candidatus Blackburnbacteria bacterium]
MKKILMILVPLLLLVAAVLIRTSVLQSNSKQDYNNARKQFAEQVRQFKEKGEIQVVKISKYNGIKTYKTVSSSEKIIALEIAIKPKNAELDLDDLQILSEEKKMLGYGWPEINLDDINRDKNFKQQNENTFVVLFVVPQSFIKGFLAYSDKIFAEVKLNDLTE